MHTQRICAYVPMHEQTYAHACIDTYTCTHVYPVTLLAAVSCQELSLVEGNQRRDFADIAPRFLRWKTVDTAALLMHTTSNSSTGLANSRTQRLQRVRSCLSQTCFKMPGKVKSRFRMPVEGGEVRLRALTPSRSLGSSSSQHKGEAEAIGPMPASQRFLRERTMAPTRQTGRGTCSTACTSGTDILGSGYHRSRRGAVRCQSYM